MNEKKKIIAGVVVGVLLLVAGYFVYQSYTYVSTDDAQIGAHVTMLSSRINGTIQKVYVDENKKVKSGEVLAEIDQADYSNASNAAEAEVASLQARYKEAELNYNRAVDLFRQQAISKEKYDSSLASYKELSARVKASEAQAQQATLNVHYTKIIAPSDGVIARKSVEPGQFVPAGQPLFGFVASDERWVTANLKETEIDDVTPGRIAHVEVDAVPHRSFEGEVESISPSTGAIFSLLPPDNATGNFTKVVQRVPVRIKLKDISSEDALKLQAGLSAVVKIRIR